MLPVYKARKAPKLNTNSSPSRQQYVSNASLMRPQSVRVHKASLMRLKCVSNASPIRP